jgi:hypothetical protein
VSSFICINIGLVRSTFATWRAAGVRPLGRSRRGTACRTQGNASSFKVPNKIGF